MDERGQNFLFGKKRKRGAPHSVGDFVGGIIVANFPRASFRTRPPPDSAPDPVSAGRTVPDRARTSPSQESSRAARRCEKTNQTGGFCARLDRLRTAVTFSGGNVCFAD